MIGKIIVLGVILLLVVLTLKMLAKNKSRTFDNDDVVDLKKGKDGKYKPKNKK